MLEPTNPSDPSLLENPSPSTGTSDSSRHVFFLIAIAGEVQPQPVVIELDKDTRPLTCRSFLELCTSPDTTTKARPRPSYRGCDFHRIVPGFCVQTGDFERFDGTGGYSPIFGRNFDDEGISKPKSTPQSLSHSVEGIVSMANSGKPNTNGSQWFITLKAVPHLNGRHVPFGKVIQGMDTVRNMLAVERDDKDRPVPMQRVTIVDCGVGMGDAKEDCTSNRHDERHSSKRRHGEERKRRRSRKSSPINRGSSRDEDDVDDRSSDSRDSPRETKLPSRKRKIKSKRREDKDSDGDEDASDARTSTASSESSYTRRKRRRKKEQKKKKKDHKKRSKKESRK